MGFFPHPAKELWSSVVLNAMKRTATHAKGLDVLGSVAPELNGCAQPRLHRYEPYEDYQFQARPEPMAQRLAELKLYLAWLADGSGWPPDVLAILASPVADAVLRRMAMRDMWDWRGALDSYRSLKAGNLEPLVNGQ